MITKRQRASLKLIVRDVTDARVMFVEKARTLRGAHTFLKPSFNGHEPSGFTKFRFPDNGRPRHDVMKKNRFGTGYDVPETLPVDDLVVVISKER